MRFNLNVLLFQHFKMFVLCAFLQFVSHHALAGDINEGDSFLLPCEFPTFDMDPTPSVLWSRYDLRPSTVHWRQQEGDAFEGQNQLYSGRTSMMPDALETGDLSLTLTRLKASDSGIYTCSIISVRGEYRVTDVQLQVKEWFPSWATSLLVVFMVPMVVVALFFLLFHQYFRSVYYVDVDSGVESVLLPCKTMLCLNRGTTVEWRNKYNIKVHQYQVGSEPTGHQQQPGQTEMKVNLCGDFSLTLKHPTEDDGGIWTCSIYNRNRDILQKRVHLWVISGVTSRVDKVDVDAGLMSVLLPFRTTVPSAQVTVEWTIETSGVKVHVFHNGFNRPEEQNWSYRHRTEIASDFSLTLKHPTDFDSRTFLCTIYSENRNILRKKEVRLNVKVCQVEFEEGEESVLLPFRTTENLPEDVVVEWRRKDLVHKYHNGSGQPHQQDKDYRNRTEMVVHKYHDGSNKPDHQDKDYRGRTEMEAGLLTSGDFSLTLKEPKVRDAGTYVCEVSNTTIQRRKTVVLQVKGGTAGHGEQERLS